MEGDYKNTYYVYEDDNNDLYYYNTETEESTYDKPENATFLDPQTNEIYVFPEDRVENEEASNQKNVEDKEKDLDKQEQQETPDVSQNPESDQDSTPKKSKKSRKKKSDSEKEPVKDSESEKETPKKSHKKKRKTPKNKETAEKEPEPDSEQNESHPVFYVLFDNDNKMYYCNEKTKETTYDKPEKAEFVDPETKEPYDFNAEVAQSTNQVNDEEKDENVESPKEETKETKKSKKSKHSESESETSESCPESSSDDDENLETYFVYSDPNNRLYYYNAKTQATQYDKPKNAKFLDPNTRKRYVFNEDEEKKKKEKKKERKEKKEKKQSDAEVPSENESLDARETKPKAKHARFQESLGDLPQPSSRKRSDTAPVKKTKEHRSHKSTIELDMVIEVPREVTKFEYVPEVKRPRSQSFLPDADKLALPANLQQDIHKFQVGEYAQKFFKEHRTHHIFSRKKISPEVLASFQDTPLSASLLTSIPKNLQKESIQCFNYILNFSGATKDKIKATSLNSLISLVDQNVPLRDEVYFQLIKQTNNNPNEECLIRTWQIFLVCASIFPSSLDSEVWIKSHLSREAMVQKNKTISDYAQFTYIRFSSRCTIGKPIENPVMSINKLLKEGFESKQVFSASIYEQLWNQRTTHKLFPVPIMLHLMAEMLLQKGAEKTEGIFRIVGNKRTVVNMEDKINKGGELDPNMVIHDLASLFKSWFAKLPDTLIPASLLPDLINASEDKSFIKFVDKLPKAHLYALKYLIGFFQRLRKSEEVTLMGASNLAICFGPDVISTGHVKDIKDFERFKDISVNLLTTLIDQLPTGDIYPLDLNAS